MLGCPEQLFHRCVSQERGLHWVPLLNVECAQPVTHVSRMVLMFLQFAHLGHIALWQIPSRAVFVLKVHGHPNMDCKIFHNANHAHLVVCVVQKG